MGVGMALERASSRSSTDGGVTGRRSMNVRPVGRKIEDMEFPGLAENGDSIST